jgi:hypothetical protein
MKILLLLLCISTLGFSETTYRKFKWDIYPDNIFRYIVTYTEDKKKNPKTVLITTMNNEIIVGPIPKGTYNTQIYIIDNKGVISYPSEVVKFTISGTINKRKR